MKLLTSDAGLKMSVMSGNSSTKRTHTLTGVILLAVMLFQKKYHSGRTNSGDENYEIFTTETIQADDKAFIMKLRDIVRAATEQVQFERIVASMQTGVTTRITSNDIPGVVELASKSYGIIEKESEGVLTHLIRGGDLSLYGLANAVTRQAQDVESYDRSTELEMTAWSILNMPRRKWAELNAA